MCVDSGWDIVAIVIATNIVLSALHAALTWSVKQLWSANFPYDDKALACVEFLLKMLNWFMANRRNPPR